MFERFTREDRMLLAFAMQEAADLGHTRLGADHLILGMLCNARSPLFALLGSQGLTLDEAREVVRAQHADDPEDAGEPVGETASQRYEEDREALRSIGIDLDKVRAAVRDRFGDDLSQGWAERPSRGDRHRGRGRGRGNCGPEGRRRGHGHRHGHGHRGSVGWADAEGFGAEPFGGEGFNDGDPRMRGPFGPGAPFGPGSFGADGPWESGRGRRGPRGRGRRPRFAPDTRDALRGAVEIARARGDQELRPEYLLIGIIDAGDAASRAVIESVTTPEALRAAVLATLPEMPTPEASADI